jgi:hypothetical protein
MDERLVILDRIFSMSGELSSGDQNQIMRAQKYPRRCNLKDVEYVHSRCSDSVFFRISNLCLLEFTIYRFYSQKRGGVS